MSSPRVGPLAKAWYKWKALRLPWRKRFLVGFDLHGNTFWEFRLTNNASERWRRIVKYPHATHLSSVKVTPQWHQWLRYTRDDPPTLEEQQGDVVRQARMKTLAAEADARWEAKPRYMDAPDGATAAPRIAPEEQQSAPSQPEVASSTERAKKPNESKEQTSDPWTQHKSKGPGEAWQPTAWDPSSTKAKTTKA